VPVNADKPHLWKADVGQSVDGYDEWFTRLAPQAYRDARAQTAERVEQALQATSNLLSITPEALRQHPEILSTLRMVTSPPIARETLIGIAHVSAPLVTAMERDGHIPPGMLDAIVDADLWKIGALLSEMADRDIFPWLDGANKYQLSGIQIQRAATIVADRLSLSVADTIIRDAHKARQVATVRTWLARHGYAQAETTRRLGFDKMEPGTFVLGITLPVLQAGKSTGSTIPIDIALMPKHARPNETPLLMEAKAAGDYARANKRRADEAAKVAELRGNYGEGVRVVQFLSGYFDSGYLGSMAAEGIDWVWEHRVDDLAQIDGVTLTPLEQKQAARQAASGAPTPLTR